MHEMKNGTLCMAILAAVAVFASPPEAPKPDEWTFRQELSKPVAYHALEAYRLADEFCLTGNLETVRKDLERFLASAGRPAAKTLTLRRGKVAGRESYRCEVCAGGNVVLTAEDADGIRRAAYWFEDRVAAGDLAPCVRRPWLRNRISRCFFGPIKRPPFNRDELMDDVDYYPDEYLNRLAHEGVNGLWLTVEWRNLVETTFNRRDPDAPRRLAKLRRTVGKCSRYGIATWVFCIEPRSMDADDPLLKACPRLTGGVKGGDGKYVLCPSTPEGRQYLEEAARDLFSQVPGLPGILNISHGERPTTCLSPIDPVRPTDCKCPNCKGLRPWEIHCRMAEAVVRGMRTVSPEAEFLSWFYQPYVEMDRLTWTADVARHLPDGVTMIYNFESGAVKPQLGRYRPGGDYWLSYVGPSPAFEKVAEASREVNGRLGAKIQVGNSHECATVPFVPVPGLLYRKYRAMKAARCSTVMQCWYFGNYPGVMNKAAGELAFDDFSETEDAFLERLARPEWGADAGTVAKLWKDLSDAYAEYPISNDMQYYGPFHSGIVWTLEPYVNMAPLARTWKPLDPPGGDVIGECLENHTVEEACLLSGRMASVAGNKTLDVLAAKYAGDRDRRLDIGVMKALGILFASGADALEFYRLRAKAVDASRERNDAAAAQRALAGMRAILLREKDLTAQMLPLVSEDSRLGFHSEAELHHFNPARLAWRMGELDRALAEVDAISRTLGKGGTYPLSEHEKTAPAMRRGEWTVAKDGKARFRADFSPNGDFVLEGEDLSCGRLRMNTIDACGVSWARHVNVRRDGTWSTDADNVITPQHEVKEYTVGPSASGWSFRLVLDCRGWGDNPARRPAWLCLVGDSAPLWPGIVPSSEYRLNIGNMSPDVYGRIW